MPTKTELSVSTLQVSNNSLLFPKKQTDVPIIMAHPFVFQSIRIRFYCDKCRIVVSSNKMRAGHCRSVRIRYLYGFHYVSAFSFGQDEGHDGADDEEDSDYCADGEDFAKQKDSEHDTCDWFESAEDGHGY